MRLTPEREKEIREYVINGRSCVPHLDQECLIPKELLQEVDLLREELKDKSIEIERSEHIDHLKEELENYRKDWELSSNLHNKTINDLYDRNKKLYQELSDLKDKAEDRLLVEQLSHIKEVTNLSKTIENFLDDKRNLSFRIEKLRDVLLGITKEVSVNEIRMSALQALRQDDEDEKSI